MEKKIGQLVYGMLQQTKVKRMKTGTKLVKRIDPLVYGMFQQVKAEMRNDCPKF